MTLLLFQFPSFCISIDGKSMDWASIPIFQKCRPRVLSRDRAGLDMQYVKIGLSKRFMYFYIEGSSITGQKADNGEGFKKTSVRISANSAQSPLNRVRVLIDPKVPYKIKMAAPKKPTVDLGSKKEKYWSRGKVGRNYFFEVKVPVFVSPKGIHLGTKSGPLVRPSSDRTSKSAISDVLINTVDMKTHRLVDTTQFYIRKDNF
jgi:hypothetical protein